MSKVSKWKKHLKFQKQSGWCGPAVVQMVLSYNGIKKRQKTIAEAIYKHWWGTGHGLMIAYLSKFFKVVNFKNNATITDVRRHLDKANIVIVNWWDDFSKNEADGHYSIIIDYDSKNKLITLADPSRTRKGIWKIKSKEFNSKWYDYLDIHGRTWTDGWMLWVDPKSKI
jgi:ABC-type bacteriocin/lantibiotic exporter with double-glycine peptidase domain